jgi:hypothetical protein
VDVASRTPLVECFQRGDVPRDVRLLAARGALAPRVHEQLQLLMLLVSDADSDVAAAAESTLALLPVAAVAAHLARPDVDAGMRDFFAARGISPTTAAPDDALGEPLVQVSEPSDTPATSPDAAPAGAPDDEGERKGAAQRLAMLSVSERVKVAMTGTREERAILVRDANRLVAAAVLSSPKLSESEVEAIARMSNVSDEVLRLVGTNRSWTKNYSVIAALTRNAKTPVGISLTLINRLTERDMRMLSMDRNIPEAVRTTARRLLVHGEGRRR